MIIFSWNDSLNHTEREDFGNGKVHDEISGFDCFLWWLCRSHYYVVRKMKYIAPNYRKVWVVFRRDDVYGIFSTKEKAQIAIETLREGFKGNGPYGIEGPFPFDDD